MFHFIFCLNQNCLFDKHSKHFNLIFVTSSCTQLIVHYNMCTIVYYTLCEKKNYCLEFNKQFKEYKSCIFPSCIHTFSKDFLGNITLSYPIDLIRTIRMKSLHNSYGLIKNGNKTGSKEKTQISTKISHKICKSIQRNVLGNLQLK